VEDAVVERHVGGHGRGLHGHECPSVERMVVMFQVVQSIFEALVGANTGCITGMSGPNKKPRNRYRLNLIICNYTPLCTTVNIIHSSSKSGIR
jgi:hypothetical protein